MEQVKIENLDQLLFGRHVPVPEYEHYREELSGRGYLMVSDHESIRDAAIAYLRQIIHLKYLDFNAEPQNKKISEMCLNAYGTHYDNQKQSYYLDLAYQCRQGGRALIVDNFQDVGLLAVRETKLALAYLRSLGRPPYEITVVAIGSKDCLELIDQDPQLKSVWAAFELVQS